MHRPIPPLHPLAAARAIVNDLWDDDLDAPFEAAAGEAPPGAAEADEPPRPS